MPRFAASLPVAFGLLALVLPASPASAQPYAVDPVHSTVLFRLKHMNTSYAFGRFNDIKGMIDLDAAPPTIEVELAVESVDTANEQRDQHLVGPDFFNAKQFPTISFKSSKVAKVDDAHYDVAGELTLHGVTRPIEVKLERTGSGLNLMGKKIVGAATEFSIKRSDYGMKHLVGPVGDEVRVIVSLEGIAQ